MKKVLPLAVEANILDFSVGPVPMLLEKFFSAKMSLAEMMQTRAIIDQRATGPDIERLLHGASGGDVLDPCRMIKIRVKNMNGALLVGELAVCATPCASVDDYLERYGPEMLERLNDEFMMTVGREAECCSEEQFEDYQNRLVQLEKDRETIMRRARRVDLQKIKDMAIGELVRRMCWGRIREDASNLIGEYDM